ncbi:MAG: BrnT family toxin [Anaerolineae bacterium]
MRFEWDEQKRGNNIRKHSIDFRDAIAIFAGDTVTMEDTRFDYGEQRFVSLGLLKGRVIVVVHTEDKDVIRLISARKATKYEQKIYYKRIID